MNQSMWLECGGLYHNSRLAFPTEPVTSEAHPYSTQARARRRFLYRRPVRSRDVAVLAQCLQQCSFSFFRLYLLYLRAVVMADRRDWGGGGDDP
ncbi:hypothetical protein Taro_000614 [Colocasia esculenta]|uniref:Uncharacterized protein n=1 Tax=Colocasia esculenta TaxID=4460 RepID=A0A843TDQ5_COLES|nr:hypothetical protein [Colocasia esculenta]